MKNLIAKITEKYRACRVWCARSENQKKIYIAITVLIALWFVYRFVMVGVESNRSVYNVARVAITDGVPVNIMRAEQKSGEIRIPIAIKNNRAYVTGARAAKLRAGQVIDGGQVVSVSTGIDYDTGMYIVQTRGVADGLQYVISRATGYFVPLYAVHGNAVYVAENGIAKLRQVNVVRKDFENAYITDGLNDGDTIILSNVVDGQKIRITD